MLNDQRVTSFVPSVAQGTQGQHELGEVLGTKSLHHGSWDDFGHFTAFQGFLQYHLVNVYITNWKITMLLMGKLTINGHFQ